MSKAAAAARKRKDTLPKGFAAVAGYTRPDPGVNPLNSEYGKRIVGVALAIDTEGVMWERVDDAPWSCLGRPPEKQEG